MDSMISTTLSPSSAFVVLRGTKPITTNALEGLKVVEIIESIYALAR
jgi:hypothetical protein